MSSRDAEGIENSALIDGLYSPLRIHHSGRGSLLSDLQRRVRGGRDTACAQVCGCYKFASADYTHLQCMHTCSDCLTQCTGEMHTRTGLYRRIIRIHNLRFVTRLPIAGETEMDCRSVNGGSVFIIRTPIRLACDQSADKLPRAFRLTFSSRRLSSVAVVRYCCVHASMCSSSQVR